MNKEARGFCMRLGSKGKLCFSIVIIVLGMLIGRTFTGATKSLWYLNLERPFWSPPNWLFPPVWFILYLLLAIGLWLFWKTPSHQNKLLGFIFYGIGLFFNFSWSPVFFGLHQIMLSALIIAAVIICLLVTMVQFYKVSKLAAWLQLPYLLWSCYALAINSFLALYN